MNILLNPVNGLLSAFGMGASEQPNRGHAPARRSGAGNPSRFRSGGSCSKLGNTVRGIASAARVVYRGCGAVYGFAQPYAASAGTRTYNAAASCVPDRVKAKYDAGYNSSGQFFTSKATKAGQGAANVAVATAAYVAYLIGNSIVDSSRSIREAIPGLTQTVVNSGLFRQGEKVTIEAVIRHPAQMMENVPVSTLGNGIVALSVILAGTALGAYCAKADYAATARKTGAWLAGAISMHACKDVAEKIITLPVFTAGAAAYKTYAYVSQVHIDTSRRFTNVATSALVFTVGAGVTAFTAQIIPQAVAILSVIDPVVSTVVTAGTLALYGQRLVGRKLKHSHKAIQVTARLATAALLATGVALIAPQLTVAHVASTATFTVSAVVLAVTTVATKGTYHASAKKTAKATAKVIGVGAAVLAFGTTLFVATYIDTMLPVTTMFFVYECSRMGDFIGTNVATLIEKSGERAAGLAKTLWAKRLAGVAVLVGFATPTAPATPATSAREATSATPVTPATPATLSDQDLSLTPPGYTAD